MVAMNDRLRYYLRYKLHKIDDDYTPEELATIEKIHLDPINDDNTYQRVDIDIISSFPNLKMIYFYNMNIDDEVINKIMSVPKLEGISLENCSIKNVKVLVKKRLKRLDLINTYIENIDDIKELKTLNYIKLINLDLPSLSFLENLPNITTIDLNNSRIKDQSVLVKFSLIERLSIYNTNIMDLNFIGRYIYLKELDISKEQFLKNRELINDLLNLNINVYEDGILHYNALYRVQNEQ